MVDEEIIKQNWEKAQILYINYGESDGKDQISYADDK
jgi:hypothetical protein